MSVDNKRGRRNDGRRKPRRHDGEKRRKKKIISPKRICPHCKVGKLKYKGPYDSVGTLSWKCNKCGKRVKKRREMTKPPEPVVPRRTIITGG